MDESLGRTISITAKGFVCGGCVVGGSSSSSTTLVSSDLPTESRMEFSDLGIVLCNGIGYVPGGGRPLAEMACWECSRLLQLGLDAEDALIGARKLVSRAALLTESGWSSILVAKFLDGGVIDLCFAGDTLGFVVGSGTAKPLGEAQIQQGAVSARLDECDRETFQTCRVHLDRGEWLCVMSGSAWRNMPLACIARTCRENAGAPCDAAAALTDAAECYGSLNEVAIAVVERTPS